MILYPGLSETHPESTTTFYLKENPNDYEHRHVNPKLLKQLPLKRLMDLKIDYAFKQFFGNEKNKQITMVFLNAIIQKTGRKKIKDIIFIDKEAGGEHMDDKESRLDLLIVTESNETINVEVQFTNKYNMIKRSIYYWAETYRNPLGKGMAYNQLQPVIAINILNFNLFSSQTDRFHTYYHLYEDEEKFKLTNVMEFHFIEMPKLIQAWKRDKLNPWEDVLARWLLLLGIVDSRNKKVYDDIFTELGGIAMEDESLRIAFENWEQLSMNPEEYHAYSGRLRRIMDDESFRRSMEVREQAVQKGQKEIDEKQQEMDEAQMEMDEKQSAMDEAQKEMDEKQSAMDKAQKEMDEKQCAMDETQKEMDVRESEIEQAIIKAVGALLTTGMGTDEIADELNLSKEKVRNIQHERGKE